jgi:cardiolipin synthase
MFLLLHSINHASFNLRTWLTRGATLLFFYSSLVGCATVPDADVVIDNAHANSDANPRVVGAKGPLTAKQSKALFERLGLSAENSDLFKRHLAVEQEIAESPLVAGNATRLLRDGEQTFDAIFDAIRAAKHHINMEYYILENVEHKGTKLVDLLVAKRQEGVAINILYDSFGSISTPPEFFDRLRKAGAKVLEFNPVNPLERRRIIKSPNDRDHRKIFVIDGHTAVVGGINLSVTYQSRPFDSVTGKEKREHWRDTDMEVRGPVVAELQKLFFDQWHKHMGEKIDDKGYFPPLKPNGSEVVRVIGSAPDHTVSRYYVTLLSAIRNAEKTIWITNSYFVPTKGMKRDLMDAARHGVDVRLLVPGKSDVQATLAAQRSHYRELLEAGVKIWESENAVLHAKTVVIDGVWSVVGSSNLDHRSVLYNDEVDVIVLGEVTGKEMERMFQEDSAKAKPIELAEWKRRPVLQRINEFFSRIFQNIM